MRQSTLQIVFLLLGCLLIGIAAGGYLSTRQTENPTLQFRFDELRDIPYAPTFSFTVTIVNPSRFEANVQLENDCSCMSFSPPALTIPGSSEAVTHCTLNLSNMSKFGQLRWDFFQEVVVKSSLDLSPQRFSIFGNVIQPFRLVDERLSLEVSPLDANVRAYRWPCLLHCDYELDTIRLFSDSGDMLQSQSKLHPAESFTDDEAFRPLELELGGLSWEELSRLDSIELESQFRDKSGKALRHRQPMSVMKKRHVFFSKSTFNVGIVTTNRVPFETQVECVPGVSVVSCAFVTTGILDARCDPDRVSGEIEVLAEGLTISEVVVRFDLESSQGFQWSETLKLIVSSGHLANYTKSGGGN